MVRIFLHLRGSFLPPHPAPLQVSSESKRLNGRFSLLAVTTLERLLLSSEMGGAPRLGSLKLLAIDERPLSVLRALFATVLGKLGRSELRGVHYHETDEVRIEGDRSDVILDGETFRAQIGQPIVLRPAQPLSFVRLAA